MLWCLLFGVVVLWLTRGAEDEGGKRVESPSFERVVQGTKVVKGGVVWANVGDSEEAVTEDLPPAVVHWRSSEHQLSEAAPWVLSAPASRLPKCEKLLLFTFKPWWGFGSEYILYVSRYASTELR